MGMTLRAPSTAVSVWLVRAIHPPPIFQIYLPDTQLVINHPANNTDRRHAPRSLVGLGVRRELNRSACSRGAGGRQQAGDGAPRGSTRARGNPSDATR